MVKKVLEFVLGKLDLPKTIHVELVPESIALLKEYGLYDESAGSSEDTEADREVVD